MKNYCCTDLHGMYDLWAQIRDYCEDDSKIYFLGDACDRGPDGIKIIQELLNDSRVIYLKGNHEDMLINAILTIDDHDIFTSRFMMTTWLANGGGATYDAFMKLSKQEQEEMIEKLQKLPYIIKNNSKLILCHAGVSPASTNDVVNTNDLLWDRNHIIDGYEQAFEEEYKDTYVIHGHTPVMNLNHYNLCNYPITINEDEKVVLTDGKESLVTGVTRYCGNHKIDLDFASFYTKTAALFDLDELKVVKYFTERR